MVFVYALFLSIKAPNIAIAMIMAIADIAMYIAIGPVTSLAFVDVVVEGEDDAAAAPTDNDVAAAELPYASVPAKVAMTVYVSCLGGVHVIWYVP